MQALSETDSDMGIERAMDRTSLSVVDLEKTNFESSLLDFDFELGEDTNVSRSNIDLSEISLQTNTGMSEPAPAPAPSRQQAEFVDTSAASQPAVGTIDIHDEVSTKLELARAYEEMGDVEGARERLEEVMADGAEQQKQMAQTILTRIA
jgi:pilus assembly protein FimV